MELSYAVSEPFWLKPGAPLYIYGTGTVAQDVWRVLTAKGIPVTAYLDHRPRENPLIAGTPVLVPDFPPITERGQAAIILAIHNREVNMRALIARLKGLGYARFVTVIDLYDHFSADLGVRYWLTNRTFCSNFKTQINSARQLWSDDLSRETYAKTLQFRLSGDYSLLPEPDMAHQYFPDDLPLWKQPMRLIDCGAYHGDAIRDLAQNGYSFSALAAFEPDQKNYAHLVSFMRESSLVIPEVSLWPCGVYAKSCQLRFASGMGEASSIVDFGETVVQCVAMDDALPNFAPTLIKMDIEGAEIEALQGARQLILAYQPALALSVYHTPSHLWEIPLWVSQLAAENGLFYTYHLRSHAHNCFDTVFYAIPTH